MPGKYLFTTLGCKVNQYETEQTRALLEGLGLRRARNHETPDIAVVNTCAVTAEASRKSRQALRRMAKRCRAVVAIGCAASEDAERLRSIEGVSAVFGHDVNVGEAMRGLLQSLNLGFAESQPLTSRKFPSVHGHMNGAAGGNRVLPVRAEQNVGRSSPRSAASQVDAATGIRILSAPLPLVKENEALLDRIDSFAGHQRAFMKIQDGCDAFCTYCIIPRLRPRLSWKPIDIAVAEAETLVRSGHREIILTGIFMGAYGRSTAIRKRFTDPGSPLARLVDALAQVPGLLRLRLSSLEPGDVDDELLDVLSRQENCVPHLHLPLQAGGADVLRRMNRQYTKDDFLAMVDQVHARLDEPAISTDIIVGFPGETDAEFQETLDVARYAGFLKIHAFPYSSRPGTAAARWQDRHVPTPIVRERMAELTKLESELSLAFRRKRVGCVERVIVETDRNAGDLLDAAAGLHHGRTDRYFPVHFEATDCTPGDVVDVRIDRVTPTRTHGTILTPANDGVPLPVLNTN